MTWKIRGNTTRRGYGYTHQKRRKELLPFAIGQRCALCNNLMTADQELALDHSTPVARGGLVGDRITHKRCNELAGAALGRETQRLQKQSPRSRNW